MLPIFILITIFVIETGNLSREKIRQQFALDAAATLEMEQYTDTLNRLAYLNGVFPERIFKEIYGGGWHGYWGNGLFPASPSAIDPSAERYPIRFAGRGGAANTPDPPRNFGILHTHLPGDGSVTLDHANRVAFSYISVYQWLGDVATSQKLVFENSVLKNHGLLRKSMWMNAHEESGTSYTCKGSMDECGDEAAKAYPGMDIRMHYVQGFKHCPVIVTVAGQTYQGELAGAFNFSGSGLWSLATVPKSQLDMFEEGFVVKHHWQPPPNYFRIDFKAAHNPYVRGYVNTSGGSVWPDPTPKYITRLRP